MEKNHREMVGILFSISIILISVIVVSEFITSLVWGGIIAIATWPLYERILLFWRGNGILAATCMVTLVTLIIALPTIWVMIVVTGEVQTFSKFLFQVNSELIQYPAWLPDSGILHQHLFSIWTETLAQPHGIEQLLSSTTQTSLKPLTSILQSFGAQLTKRTMVLGFTILSLFFLYKDGEHLVGQINAMGRYFLAGRWNLYCNTLPNAIKATVNGLIIVGIGVGMLMGFVYAVAGVPAPTLLGGVTAVLAMIPFGVIFAFGLAMLLLILEGKFLVAMIVVGVGTGVMFIADHFVRPSIIGGATRLPFLAVLFGILGGVKTFGLVGLFVGPIVMVLFTTLWREAELFH